jgi:hypothetical protein
MKTTNKVLVEQCQQINSTLLKELFWGLKINQKQTTYELLRVSRKSSTDVLTLASGTPKEIAVAIEAIRTLVTFELGRAQ